ncbi:hypothetical protein GCM10010497_59290 [Streptomyces cinereoruber]|uniref:Uncharacterized protein n=1 Tax=Streptomyces cinereoruber TaxID=67260 RepID=A0AAV4KS88_9ACTN|nr:hypothetical protein [Streptomyces cinereoruber]NIH65410.1 hypothetical protein [Streptomyces cinereoruber]GGR48065.1 hypothetical protein GCM10010497_59290 [Streptomyces cinereoruber]
MASIARPPASRSTSTALPFSSPGNGLRAALVPRLSHRTTREPPLPADQDRIRYLTVALPPIYAARLFDVQDADASDAELQEIAAEALKEVYFQDGGRRAGSLEEVRFTDVQHLEFDL